MEAHILLRNHTSAATMIYMTWVIAVVIYSVTVATMDRRKGDLWDVTFPKVLVDELIKY